MRRMDEQVFLYHFAAAKEAKIMAVLQRLQIKARRIEDTMTAQKVGYLIGMRGFKETAGQPESAPFDQEVMLLKDIRPKRLNQILAGLEEAGVERIAMKAVVTPYNVWWSFARLCETIRREHGVLAEEAPRLK